MAFALVVLLFCIVLAVSISNLNLAASLFAAVLVAAVVGGSSYLFMSSTPVPADRNHRLVEMLQHPGQARRGIRDETSGLHTRWYLERRLNEEAARCRRYSHSMAVVVLKAVAIDLARFSLDGWQDESAAAARRSAQIIRNVDLSAALAPFEFAMCLVHCDRNGAEAAIRRMSEEFRDYECQVGIAVYPDDACEPDALIDLARVRSRQVETA